MPQRVDLNPQRIRALTGGVTIRDRLGSKGLGQRIVLLSRLSSRSAELDDSGRFWTERDAVGTVPALCRFAPALSHATPGVALCGAMDGEGSRAGDRVPRAPVAKGR
jgi:hypothetical protein